MLGMGWGEIFIVLVVALVVIGPDKIPEVARGLAKAMRQMQRFAQDIRDSVDLDEIQNSNRTAPAQAQEPEPLAESERLDVPPPPVAYPNAENKQADADEDDWYEEEAGYQYADGDEPAAPETPAEPASSVQQDENKSA
ncbi:Sec-independent protein translocase subunit TatA/TatB [Magnetococcus sp. PR-3]|uniref:Sec-independent protein translocase subunit TatA/TatB n=1 Tax=Magnetococcus sp. PR-3 TaxID=3120355 RepID=UPI002FCE1190